MNPSSTEPQPLRGAQRALGAIMLAMANFLAILDTTIANVSVSNIAGSLGTSKTVVALLGPNHHGPPRPRRPGRSPAKPYRIGS